MKKLTECDGMKYTAKIGDVECKGKVTVQEGEVYLCQNEKNGSICKDRKGYGCSWSVGHGEESGLRGNSVTDFTLQPENPETYKDWQVGDKIGRADLLPGREVILRSGELVVCKDGNGNATSNYTCDELYNEGWRLIAEPSEPEMVELTLEQVAALAGVDVKTLRIKDK